MTHPIPPQFTRCLSLLAFCLGGVLSLASAAASTPGLSSTPSALLELPPSHGRPDPTPASADPSPATAATDLLPSTAPPLVSPDSLRPLGPAHSSPSTPPGAASSPSAWQSWSWLIQTAAALALVLGLILLLRLLLSRASAATPWLTPTSGRGIDLLARRCISPRHYVLILRLGHRLLVVGQSPAGFHPLASIRHPDEIAAVLTAISSNRPGSSTADFHSTLNQLTRTWPTNQQTQGDSTEIHVDRARDNLRALLSRLRLLGREQTGS